MLTDLRIDSAHIGETPIALLLFNGPQRQRAMARDVLFTRYRILCDSVLQMFNVSSEVKKALSNRLIGFNENGKATLMLSEQKLQLMTCKVRTKTHSR